jgi:7-carboxy-7-deazaguanine synthase
MARAGRAERPMKPSAPRLQINEIFHSIQGESSHAGRPTVFVRLTGCTLRCGYCDTTYSYAGGGAMTIDEILGRVAGFETPLIEITGGEPLEQPAAIDLMTRLLESGFTVMLETGGHVSIRTVPPRVIKIVDIKCPDSGEGETFLMENLDLAAPHDEFKLVIASRRDYEWSRAFHERHLAGRGNTVLFSPAHGVVEPRDLASWILADRLPVRLQLQVHKYVWGADARGV